MAGNKVVKPVIGILALGALGVILWIATRAPPLTVQGEVTADRVDVSPRVSGRIIKLGADVGSSYDNAALLAEI